MAPRLQTVAETGPIYRIFKIRFVYITITPRQSAKRDRHKIQVKFAKSIYCWSHVSDSWILQKQRYCLLSRVPLPRHLAERVEPAESSASAVVQPSLRLRPHQLQQTFLSLVVLPVVRPLAEQPRPQVTPLFFTCSLSAIIKSKFRQQMSGPCSENKIG